MRTARLLVLAHVVLELLAVRRGLTKSRHPNQRSPIQHLAVMTRRSETPFVAALRIGPVTRAVTNGRRLIVPTPASG
jgi:hypothetical protein